MRYSIAFILCCMLSFSQSNGQTIKEIDRRVIPFLDEKEISAEVLLMTDLDYNSWIDRVDPTWSGAIPATLIYNRERRVFLEKELTRDELFNHVSQIHQ